MLDESVRGAGKERHSEVVITTVENVEAIYVGQNDNDTVEIIIDGKPNTFLLKYIKKQDIQILDKNDKINISYMIKSEQNKDGEIKGSYLTKIEKVYELPRSQKKI